STPGRGSTFALRIDPGPLDGVRLIDTPGDAAAESVSASPRPTAALAGRILVADDVPANRHLISIHLSRAGAEVQVADNGVEACAMALAATAAGTPFDLILMDIQMP